MSFIVVGEDWISPGTSPSAARKPKTQKEIRTIVTEHDEEDEDGVIKTVVTTTKTVTVVEKVKKEETANESKTSDVVDEIDNAQMLEAEQTTTTKTVVEKVKKDDRTDNVTSASRVQTSDARGGDNSATLHGAKQTNQASATTTTANTCSVQTSRGIPAELHKSPLSDTTSQSDTTQVKTSSVPTSPGIPSESQKVKTSSVQTSPGIAAESHSLLESRTITVCSDTTTAKSSSVQTSPNVKSAHQNPLSDSNRTAVNASTSPMPQTASAQTSPGVSTGPNTFLDPDPVPGNTTSTIGGLDSVASNVSTSQRRRSLQRQGSAELDEQDGAKLVKWTLSGGVWYNYFLTFHFYFRTSIAVETYRSFQNVFAIVFCQ